MQDLLHALTTTRQSNTSRPDWPKTPRALSCKLRHLAPQLRMIGINVEFGGANHNRIVTITLTKEDEQLPVDGVISTFNVKAQSLSSCTRRRGQIGLSRSIVITAGRDKSDSSDQSSKTIIRPVIAGRLGVRKTKAVYAKRRRDSLLRPRRKLISQQRIRKGLYANGAKTQNRGLCRPGAGGKRIVRDTPSSPRIPRRSGSSQGSSAHAGNWVQPGLSDDRARLRIRADRTSVYAPPISS